MDTTLLMAPTFSATPDPSFTIDYIEGNNAGYFSLKLDVSVFNNNPDPFKLIQFLNLYTKFNGEPIGFCAFGEYKANANIFNAYVIAKDFSTYAVTDRAQSVIRELFGDYLAQINPTTAFSDPPGWKKPLKAHQAERVSFVIEARRAIIAWNVGLGKTLFSLYCSEVLRSRGEIRRTLIVCPASLRETVWVPEIESSCAASYAVASGTKEERCRIYASDVDYVIVSYDALRTDADVLREAAFDHYILDESSAIKNAETHLYAALKRICAAPRYALLLNGTPVENVLEDLYHQLALIYPELDEDLFHNIFHVGSESQRRARAMLLLRPYICAADDSVVRSTPPVYEVESVELSSRQRRLYDKVRASALEALDRGQREAFFGALVRLQQIANDPALVGVAGESAKLTAFDSFYEESKQRGEKYIYFTQFKQWATQLAVRHEGLVLFCGGMNDTDRAEAVRAFRGDPHVRGIIITEAGARGLNLPEASRVVLLDSLWNPQKITQIVGRAHRPALQREYPVRVTKLVAKNTLEERKESVLEQKKELAALVADATLDWKAMI